MRKPAASDPYLFLYLQPCTTIPVIGLGAAGIRGFLPDAGSILACPTPLTPYDGLGRGEKGGGGFTIESHGLAQPLFRRAEPWIDNRIEVPHGGMAPATCCRPRPCNM